MTGVQLLPFQKDKSKLRKAQGSSNSRTNLHTQAPTYKAKHEILPADLLPSPGYSELEMGGTGHTGTQSLEGNVSG